MQAWERGAMSVSSHAAVLGAPIMQIDHDTRGSEIAQEPEATAAKPHQTVVSFDTGRVVTAIHLLTEEVAALRADLEYRSLRGTLRRAWARIKFWLFV